MRHLSSALASLALATTLSSGCSLSPAPHASRGQPIIGGVNDTADPGVVMVYAQDRNGGASICTGEVVSPHVVLTAAHCVSPQTVGTGITFAIFTGSDSNDPAQSPNADPSLWHSVKETHYNMLFDVNNLRGGHDVGVVITKNALSSITPLPMNRTPLQPGDRGAPLRIVGYGVNDGQDTAGTSAGTKRQATTSVMDYDASLLYLGDATYDTCHGDSGGPAFLMQNGVEVIAGITSFGASGCLMGAADTRVDLYASSFVDPYIMQFDPGQASPDLTMSPADMTTQAPPDLTSGGTDDLTVAAPPDLTTSSAPDLAQASSVDMARPRGNGDMGLQSGAVGSDCHKDTDCSSGICALAGTVGFCTQPCDPKMVGACPGNTHCGVIDHASYCVRTYSQASGCDVSRGRGAPTHGALAVLGLALVGLVVRRRHAG